MEIRQQKHSNKIRFAFGEEALDYSLEDSSGSRSYSVPYTDISRDRQTLVERNQWLGNQFRSEYAFMPEGDSPKRHRARLKRLRRARSLMISSGSG